LRAYYANARQAGIPRLEDSRDKYYQNLKEAIRDFYSLGKKR
jgi:hypothetical protein